MSEPDDALQRISSAFHLHCRGDRAEARARMDALWEELDPHGDPYHRSVLAHFIADTQLEAAEELAWDERALQIAEQALDTATARASAAALEKFLPSLHMNLADGYRKAGDFDRAQHHVERGMQLGGGLGLDPYGQTVRAGLIRIQTQLDERDSGPAMIFDFE